MEDNNDNIFQRQDITMARTKLGKPPTRLQKQAPATLQLDQLISSANANNFSPSSESGTSLTAIPLLSPLIISPQPETEEFRFPKCGNDIGSVEKKGALSEPSGWQHPAVAGYTETSSLFAFFQSKCMLVNDVQ